MRSFKHRINIKEHASYKLEKQSQNLQQKPQNQEKPGAPDDVPNKTFPFIKGC